MPAKVEYFIKSKDQQEVLITEVIHQDDAYCVKIDFYKGQFSMSGPDLIFLNLYFNPGDQIIIKIPELDKSKVSE